MKIQDHVQDAAMSAGGWWSEGEPAVRRAAGSSFGWKVLLVSTATIATRCRGSCANSSVALRLKGVTESLGSRAGFRSA
jgi:hypothetical protein